jgi:integrase
MFGLEQAEADPSGPTLRKYAAPFFIWDRCPHVRRLVDEGKCLSRYHAKNMRSILKNHLFPDPICKLKGSAIKRADILDYRERLIGSKGSTRTAQNAVSALRTILKEAYFREDIDRDPTQGIGVTTYRANEVGIFTEEELRTLFPAEPPGPWQDLYDYGVILTAATTGMRRGEILALTWECARFDRGTIDVVQARKDRHELGLPSGIR